VQEYNKKEKEKRKKKGGGGDWLHVLNYEIPDDFLSAFPT
jgi:hypothetical protein